MNPGDLVKIKKTKTVGILLQEPEMFGFVLRAWVMIAGIDGISIHEWVDIDDLDVLSKGNPNENR